MQTYQSKDWCEWRGKGPGAGDLPDGRITMMMMLKMCYD